MVTACKAVAKEEQQLHVETCEKMKERILELRDAMAAYKSNPMVKSISDIEHIFRSNKIDTALTTPLQQLKSSFLAIENGVTDLLASVDRFNAEDREELTRALMKDSTIVKGHSGAMPDISAGTDETSLSSLGS